MVLEPSQRKMPLSFYRSSTGAEPVRDWLKSLDELDCHEIGSDLMRAQWRWPVGMPLCRPMGQGLWEVRVTLPSQRIARVMLCVQGRRLVALHGFIKKTEKTPVADLELARKRQKELQNE